LDGFPAVEARIRPRVDGGHLPRQGGDDALQMTRKLLPARPVCAAQLAPELLPGLRHKGQNGLEALLPLVFRVIAPQIASV